MIEKAEIVEWDSKLGLCEFAEVFSGPTELGVGEPPELTVDGEGNVEGCVLGLGTGGA